MAATVSFDGDGGMIVIPGPHGPTDITLQPMWVSGQTESLQRYVYRGTDTTSELWRLAWQNLSLANRQDFDDFFRTVAKGPENTFEYTHTDGLSYTARFVDTGLSWSRESAELWGVSVTLEVSGQVNVSSSSGA